MGVVNLLEKIYLKMGEGNNATLVSSSIAAAKGIFRPISTMSDKKEDMETKKYTAIREFLTEFIAIPTYIASGKVADKVIKWYDDPKRFIGEARKALGYKGSILTKEVVEKANQLHIDRMPKIKSNAQFLGIGLSALIIIPALCSVVIKPIMGALKKSAKPKTEETANNIPSVKIQPQATLKTQNFIYNDKYSQLSSFSRQYSSLKIGGV